MKRILRTKVRVVARVAKATGGTKSVGSGTKPGGLRSLGTDARRPERHFPM